MSLTDIALGGPFGFGHRGGAVAAATGRQRPIFTASLRSAGVSVAMNHVRYRVAPNVETAARFAVCMSIALVSAE